MSARTIIQCSCGQESQLVFLDGKWRFDIARHGNGEPCEGLCFNCRAPLKDEELFPVETADEPVPAKGPAAKEDGPAEPTMANTKAELIMRAEDLGIDVPKKAKKAEILDLILDARAGEDDPGEE